MELLNLWILNDIHLLENKEKWWKFKKKQKWGLITVKRSNRIVLFLSFLFYIRV